jgi:uncharacterized protein
VAFLLIHGLQGSGREHWQSWLAERLSARGLHVAYPSLPDADNPQLDLWLDALDGELARLPAAETTVLCHSLGSLLLKIGGQVFFVPPACLCCVVVTGS